MGTTNVSQAAQIASEFSGLPADVTATLISIEGPSASAPNNPFDITKTWADFAGFGDKVTGLWNSVGVAIFGQGSERQAIQAWAYGLLNFSNYIDVRKVINTPGASVQDFFDALAKTGYAGGDPNYADNLKGTYFHLTGKDPGTVALDGKRATIPTTTNPQEAFTGAQAQASAGISLPAIPNPFAAITDSFAGIGNAIDNAVTSVERFFWIFIGLVLVMLGLWILLQQSKTVQDIEVTAGKAAVV